MTNNEILIPPWNPSFIYQPGDFIRLSATQIGTVEERLCLDNFALKSRPTTKISKTFTQNQAEEFHSFPLGLLKDAFVSSFNAQGLAAELSDPIGFIKDALDQICSNLKNEIHQATKKWLADATMGFAKAWEKAAQLDIDINFAKIIDPIAFTQANVPVEWFAWGIYLTDEDFNIRELRLLKMHSAGSTPINNLRLLTIIKILRDGQANNGMDYRSPTEPLPGIWPTPERIRIREIGVLDGSEKLIFDQLVSELIFDESELNNAVLPKLAGGERKVSADCLKCKANSVCPSLITSPGLLGVLPTASRVRSLSPSKLQSYQRCNRAYFLQHELSLHNISQPASAQQKRGNWVHAWIEAAHKRNQTCHKADLPSASELGIVAKSLGWNQEQADVSLPYLKQHLIVCPIKSGTNLKNEVEMWVLDSDAQTLLGTRPDLIYLNKNTLTWRETKSTDKTYDLTAENFMDVFPQIPLAVVLMSQVKQLPNLPNSWSEAKHRKVELEVLNSEDANLIQYDIADPLITHLAWQKLAQASDKWINDSDFIPMENPPCNWCQFSSWCEFANTQTRIAKYQGVTVDLSTGEIIDSEPALNHQDQIARALGLITSLSENPDDSDSVPF